MSWFDTKSFSKYAKTALKQAQKNIDKVLDIKEDDGKSENAFETKPTPAFTSTPNHASCSQQTPAIMESDTFFDSFLGEASTNKISSTFQPPVTSSKLESENELSHKPNLDQPNQKINCNNQKLDIRATKIDSGDAKEHRTVELSGSLVKKSKQREKKLVDRQKNKPRPSIDVDKYGSPTKLKTDSISRNSNKNFESLANIEAREKSSGVKDDKDHSICISNSFATPDAYSSQELNIMEKDEALGKPFWHSSKSANTALGELSVSEVFAADYHDSAMKIDVVSIANDTNECKLENIVESLPQEVGSLSDATEQLATQKNDHTELDQPSNKLTELSSSERETQNEDEDFADENNLKIDANTLNSPVPGKKVANNVAEVKVLSYELTDCVENTTNCEIAVEKTEVNGNGKQFLESNNTSVNNDDNKSLGDKNSSTFIEVETDSNCEKPNVKDDKCMQNVGELLSQIRSLEEEIQSLKSIVETRENKMVQLSHDNISLQESNAVYRSQIEQYESSAVQDDSEMEELRQEFTTRIGEMNEKLQNVVKERDDFKQKYKHTESKINKSENELLTVLNTTLVEKEEMIKGLLEEGEMWSKKELESNTRMKKLRAKLKDTITKNEQANGRIIELEAEVDTIRATLINSENLCRTQQNELKKLEDVTDSQEDEVTTLKDSIDDAEERLKAMQSTLDNAYSEINKLNLEKAQKESEASEGTAALAAKEELEQRVKDIEKKSLLNKDKLTEQLEDLQMAYSRLEVQAARQEDRHKREVQDLLKRLEDGELRNQDLSDSISTATRPLLRQITNLQSNQTNQTENWERLEQNLTDRLATLQQQQAVSAEMERSATEIANQMAIKFIAMEKQCKELKQERNGLITKLEMEIELRSTVEEQSSKARVEFEKQCSKLHYLNETLENEKSLVEEQLSAEKIQRENEMVRLSCQLASNEMTSCSRKSSSGSLSNSQADISTIMMSHRGRLSSSNSLYDMSLSNTRATTTTAAFESLKSQLRNREGEIFVLKEEVKSLEQTKFSLAEDLVQLSLKMEQMEISCEDLTQLKTKHVELSSRYNAVLQMYGEKEEETEELRMDLHDVKTMYKQQIQELLLCSGKT